MKECREDVLQQIQSRASLPAGKGCSPAVPAESWFSSSSSVQPPLLSPLLLSSLLSSPLLSHPSFNTMRPYWSAFLGNSSSLAAGWWAWQGFSVCARVNCAAFSALTLSTQCEHAVCRWETETYIMTLQWSCCCCCWFTGSSPRLSIFLHIPLHHRKIKPDRPAQKREFSYTRSSDTTVMHLIQTAEKL